jgi:hypothetical protein
MAAVSVGSRFMTASTASKRLENTSTLFARKREFGFLCPAFTMGISGDGFLLPRSAKQLLRRSLITAKVATRDITGRYFMAIHYQGSQFCNVPVIVAWASHPSFGNAFLAVKVSDEQKLRRSLKPLVGKDVELVFRPRLAPHLARPANLRA